jgi:hypothetical protein
MFHDFEWAAAEWVQEEMLSLKYTLDKPHSNI